MSMRKIREVNLLKLFYLCKLIGISTVFYYVFRLVDVALKLYGEIGIGRYIHNYEYRLKLQKFLITIKNCTERN